MDGEKVIRLIRQMSPGRRVEKTEWRVLSEELDLPRPTNCKACGHQISNLVRLALKGDIRRQVHLGLDCFAFLQAQWGGAPLPSSSRASARVRSQFVARLGEIYRTQPFAVGRSGGSWSHWLQVEAERPSRQLSIGVQAGVKQLRDHGFIQDPRLLEACVEYYNHNRTFDARVVLGSDWKRFVASSLTQLTIARALVLRANLPTVALKATDKEMARAIDEAMGGKVFDDEQVPPPPSAARARSRFPRGR